MDNGWTLEAMGFAWLTDQDLTDIEFAQTQVRNFAQKQKDTMLPLEVETLPGGHLAHDLREHALGHGVGLDPIGRGHVRDRRGIDIRAAHDPLEQPFLGEVSGAARGAIAEADGMERGDLARMSGVAEALADRGHDPLGHSVSASRSSDHDRVAVANQRCGVIRGNDAHEGIPPGACPARPSAEAQLHGVDDGLSTALLTGQ